MAKCKTRSEGQIFDFDKEFPPCKTFQPPTQLPTVRSVIGLLRYHLEVNNVTGPMRGKVSTEKAIREVAKQIYAKYYHDTVYCVHTTTIARRIKELKHKFTEGKKRLGENSKVERTIVKEYKMLYETKNNLFEVYESDPDKQTAIAEDWGVKMTSMEHQYYEDQKTDRKMICSKGVDPVWYQTMMRAQREKEKKEEYRRVRDQDFQYKDIDKITEILIESGEIITDSNSDKEQLEHEEKRVEVG